LGHFISNGAGKNAFNNYLERMLQNGTWGDHVEILALSGVMKVRFVVVKDDREVITISYEDMDPKKLKNPNIPTYYLAFAQKQMHYFSIKKDQTRNNQNLSNEVEIKAREKFSVQSKSTTQLKETMSPNEVIEIMREKFKDKLLNFFKIIPPGKHALSNPVKKKFAIRKRSLLLPRNKIV